VVGRRGGKSFILATFRTWRPYLQPGERGAVMVPGGILLAIEAGYL